MILTNQAEIKLPQLPLITFSGDPKLWRQFWCSFKAAVHEQNIPDIQKLNYLISCLKGDALLAVRSYDIAPENYDVIIGLLMEKYSFFIRKLLYNERNDRDWKATIEAMERMLRQLEAIGENLEHPSIEISIENKLPAWIVDKLYQLKEESTSWSVKGIQQYLTRLVLRNEEVVRSQADTKEKKANKYNVEGETSALATINSSKRDNTIKLKRVPEETPVDGERPCGINVINPNRPEIQQKALTLFDIGSQLSFISKDLVYRLNLQGTKEMELKIASFSNKIPKTCLNTKTEIGIYSVRQSRELKIRIFIDTKVGAMLAGSGYINKVHDSKTISVDHTYLVNAINIPD
ncbi:unnamed protein product [Wuchereria bancrofti]|uniref:DUF1758 domain-containing protein n=1 Tax=Wuchereria bancrofti TaxID=6293 RepID=A0A3P7FWU3_WUCBA|nr:unnamed protein product [Wuchereria bancrofti]